MMNSSPIRKLPFGFSLIKLPKISSLIAKTNGDIVIDFNPFKIHLDVVIGYIVHLMFDFPAEKPIEGVTFTFKYKNTDPNARFVIQVIILNSIHLNVVFEPSVVTTVVGAPIAACVAGDYCAA
jgi:hypothetical protein